jgi:cytokinin dehydrogenase
MAADRSEVSDFGNLVYGAACDTFEPASVPELVEIVTQARRTRAHITLRGAGASQSGQSVPRQSALLSTKRLTQVGAVDVEGQTVVCEAGASYRSVLDKCSKHGLTVRVIPVFLDLTVGGVLSAGGLGTSSHRWGPAVAQVAWLEVVLGTGELVVADAEQNRDVFDAVLGGVGRCGVLTRVALRLEPAPRAVCTLSYSYNDVEDLIQGALSVGERALYLEAFCLASSLDGTRHRGDPWGYDLRATFAVDEAGRPDAALPDALQHRQVKNYERSGFDTFCKRYEARVSAISASGMWTQKHPWFETILPAREAVGYIKRVLPLLPPSLGDAHRVAVIAGADVPKAMALPPDPRIVFAILPPVVHDPELAEALDVLRQLELQASELGGRRYLSGYLFDTTEAAWRRHYGSDYDFIRCAKREYDPENVFTSMLSQP